MSNDFFQTIYDRLFAPALSAKGKADGEPIIKHPVNSPLVRSEKYEKAFVEWKNSKDCAASLAKLKALFHQAMGSENTLNNGFSIHTGAGSSGFFFTPETGIPVSAFPYLMDYFRDKLLTEPYELYGSNIKYTDKKAGVTCVERHYLKPKASLRIEPPYGQLYGNVIIEVHQLDGAREYLKLMANVHQGRNYADSISFFDLINLLFAEC